jgi:hypothetical protein
VRRHSARQVSSRWPSRGLSTMRRRRHEHPARRRLPHQRTCLAAGADVPGP